MIVAVITEKNERLRLSPRLSAMFDELVAMGDDIDALHAGQIQVDVGPAELQARCTKVRPRVKVGR